MDQMIEFQAHIFPSSPSFAYFQEPLPMSSWSYFGAAASCGLDHLSGYCYVQCYWGHNNQRYEVGRCGCNNCLLGSLGFGHECERRRKPRSQMKVGFTHPSRGLSAGEGFHHPQEVQAKACIA
ncbi:hypothetical protein WN944_007181 [Citrus x changshan-huyou]|uniref:Uncharacterized protein n=1 Tax=Citrus x changshan-huyou TaxID=2935761 RepID=A0AAP0MKJ0_9ROSI